MSDDKSKDNKETSAKKDESADSGTERQKQESAQNGPKFTESPDPLSGIKKNVTDVMDRMEGKTVSMKVYLGTIIGVVILMLLARCGG